MTTRSLLLISLLAPVSALASVTSAPPPPAVPPPLPVHSADECAVWARETGFARSVADHDLTAFAGYIEAGAAFDAGGPEPTRGRGQVVASWQSLVEGKSLRLSWYPTRVTIGGVPDVAYSSGPALYEDTQPVPTPRVRIGRYESVWHRGPDGVWRVLFDGGVPPHQATQSEVDAFIAGRDAPCPRG